MQVLIQLLAGLFFSSLAITANSQMTGIPIGIYRSGGEENEAWEYLAEIYEKKGKLHAKVIQLGPGATLHRCDQCPAPRNGAPMLGLDIIWDVEKEKGRLSPGKILNPQTGKTYDCQLRPQKDGSLHIRAYFKWTAFGQTLIWKPVNSNPTKQ